MGHGVFHLFICQMSVDRLCSTAVSTKTSGDLLVMLELCDYEQMVPLVPRCRCEWLGQGGWASLWFMDGPYQPPALVEAIFQHIKDTS